MKKRFLSVWLCMVLVLCSMGIAYASDASSLVTYDPESEEISVSGTTGGSSAVITVYKSGEDALSDDNLPADVDIAPVNDGKFAAVLRLSEGSDLGKYTVRVSMAEKSTESDFIYFKLSQANELLPDILNKDESEFKRLVSKSASELGIDKDDSLYKDYSGEILSLLYSFKKNIENGADFYKNYNIALALKYLSHGETEDMLKRFESILGISYENDYEKNSALTSKAKEQLITLLKNADFAKGLSTQSFSEYYQRLAALAAVQTAQSGAQLRQIIEVDFSKLFPKISGADYKIYSAMMKCRYTSFEDIEENFDKCKDSAKDTGKTQGGGSSVSATYSASTAPKTYVPPVQVQDDTKENAQQSTDASFSDVSEQSWFYGSVTELAKKGIISGRGDGTFAPEAQINRAEFTKMVYCALKDYFPQMKKADGRATKVACVGDSLTQGLIGEDGAYTKEKTYTDFLSPLLGDEYTVSNFGRSAYGILENHKYPYLSTDEYKASLKFAPDILVTMFGTNDIKTDYWSDARAIYKERYEYFINSYKAVNADLQVVIVLPPPFFTNDSERPIENLNEAIEILKELAKENGYTVVDANTPFAQSSTLFPDGLHFNEQGAQKTAEIIARALSTGNNVSFEDVGNEWFAQYINPAASLGLVSGTGAGFVPYESITRQDAAVIIYRALSKIGHSLIGIASYTDNIDIAPYAFTAIGGLSKYKIVQGFTGEFQPRGNLTRAQAAQLLYNTLSYAGGQQ